MSWRAIVRVLVKCILQVIRVPFLIILVVIYAIYHALKYFCLHPFVIRLVERVIDRLICGWMQTSSSYNKIHEGYHREHELFDFVKHSKGNVHVE